MTDSTTTPRLRLSHSTLAVVDMQKMIDFYCDVLGFLVTNRGDPGDGSELAFLCQDPTEHHQIVMVRGLDPSPHDFVLVDHLAFRTGDLDDLRAIGRRLDEAGVEGVMPISHGNAWSLYFTDPEGNGLECFVDSPFHVAQPYGDGFDLSADDAAIEEATRRKLESLPEFQPLHEWKAAFAARLDGAGE